MASLAPAALAREGDPRAALPYARHVTDHIVGLDTQALMMAFRLDGASFETADVRDLNDAHAKLNGAWRNLADDRLAVWHHLVRREHHGYPAGRFRSDFCSDIFSAAVSDVSRYGFAAVTLTARRRTIFLLFH